jgi:hypothetical protein
MQYVTVAYRDSEQSTLFCEFATKPLWLYLLFEYIKMQMNVDILRLKNEKLSCPNIPERERILGTDVPCVKKRELLVLLNKPLEMRYWQNVDYCKQVYVA